MSCVLSLGICLGRFVCSCCYVCLSLYILYFAIPFVCVCGVLSFVTSFFIYYGRSLFLTVFVLYVRRWLYFFLSLSIVSVRPLFRYFVISFWISSGRSFFIYFGPLFRSFVSYCFSSLVII